MTTPRSRTVISHQARPGDLVVAHAATPQGDTYEIGVVTRTGPDGLADAWRTADGSLRAARFIPGLQHRWLVPRDHVHTERALNAASNYGRPFTSVTEIRAAIRPWLCHPGTKSSQKPAPDNASATSRTEPSR